MRADHQNKGVNAVATTLVFGRVESHNLADYGSQQVLKNTNLSNLVGKSRDDLECLRLRYRAFTKGTFTMFQEN